MVQGVLGGGENQFSPHDFFIFLFSPIKIWKWNYGVKKSLKIKERTWKATSFHISSPPYLLSNSVKWGVSGSTPDLWEFSENGDHVDAWQMKKNLPSPQGLFWQEKVCTHNSRDGAGGLGRWGKPIFPTCFFFFFFFFLLSKNLKVSLNLLPIVAHTIVGPSTTPTTPSVKEYPSASYRLR